MNEELVERYLNNLRECRSISRPDIPPSLSDDEIIGTISKNAARAHEIMAESNSLLSEMIFSKNPSGGAGR